MSSGRSSIRRRMRSAPKKRAALTMTPIIILKASDTPMARNTLSIWRAPRNCEQSTDVPAVVASKTRKSMVKSCTTTPTAATVLSEHWLSMTVSTMPSRMISTISMKMGPVSRTSQRRMFCCSCGNASPPYSRP